mmetsp:Transcript_19472/g.41999  ORF Transcript_19472/g.41999 Transcript_19472/m.41999 type:complete len:85 (+) Transcript_19472:390-644(+)
MWCSSGAKAASSKSPCIEPGPTGPSSFRGRQLPSSPGIRRAARPGVAFALADGCACLAAVVASLRAKSIGGATGTGCVCTPPPS